MTACIVETCGAPAAAKGYCHLHYNRWRRGGDPCVAHRIMPRAASVAERLVILTDRSGGPRSCWPFTGAVNRSGYGWVQINGVRKGLHVWAFEDAFGPVPDGRVVRHTCDNRLCANPAHLVLGSHQDNMDDKVARGRQARQVGASNPMAKLTADDVDLIRVYRANGWTLREVAERFRVSQSTVSAIVRGKRWASGQRARSAA